MQLFFCLKDEHTAQSKSIYEFYLCIECGPRHQFSNWASNS